MTAPLFELEGKRIYVAGHNEITGSAIVRRLRVERALTIEHRELDLTEQEATEIAGPLRSTQEDLETAVS